MEKRAQLLLRLNEIGKALEGQEGALVLLGVGSTGLEIERMDDYSDLDFFVFVQNGYKQRFISLLDWLEEVYPLAYEFQNSEVGSKILFEDGIYCEYAIFEERDIPSISYKGGRVVWKHPRCDLALSANGNVHVPNIRRESIDHPLNEALTNLYVGLKRYARGEKLSAVRFIQSYSIDSILSMLHLVEQETDYYPDPYGNERRLEKRFPRFAKVLPDMITGYNRVPESALAILAYLEQIAPVHSRLSMEIRKLAGTMLGN